MITKSDIRKLQTLQNSLNKNDFVKSFIMFGSKNLGNENAKFIGEDLWDEFISKKRNWIDVINIIGRGKNNEILLNILIDIINNLKEFN